LAAGCFCPGLEGQTCGRIIDCGEPDGLCDLCQADQAVILRINTMTQSIEPTKEELISNTLNPFVVLSGKTVVREGKFMGHKQATATLKPLDTERLAMIIDIPREG